MTSVTIKEFFAQSGSKFSHEDAKVIGPVLIELAKEGDVTSDQIVEAAQSTNSPLHSYFEWNDQTAAGIYRKQQADEMIRSVRVRYVKDNQQLTGRAFAVVDSKAIVPAKLQADSFLRDSGPDDMQEIGTAALKDLNDWQKKYLRFLGRLKRTEESFTLILNQIDEFKSEYPEPRPINMADAISQLEDWVRRHERDVQFVQNAGQSLGYMTEAIADARKIYERDNGVELEKDEIEILNERIKILESQIFGDSVNIPIEFGLTKSERKIFAVLLNRESVSKEIAEMALYGDRLDVPEGGSNVANVLIHRLRKKLEPFNITIDTFHGQGFMMDGPSKENVRSRMNQHIPVAAE